MKGEAMGAFSIRPSLLGGADSLGPAAVEGAAEPRRSERLTARTAGKESQREGRTTGMVKKTSGIQAKPSTERLRPEIPKLTAVELEALLRRLNLAQTRRIYQEVAARAEKEEWSYRDFLAFLLAEEVAHRQQTRLVRFTRKAHFPFFKTIEEFDFQQTVNAAKDSARFVSGSGLRSRRALVDPAREGRPGKNPFGGGHRVSSHPEWFRDVVHYRRKIHRGSF